MHDARSNVQAPASRRVPEFGRPSPPQPFGFQEQPIPELSLPQTLPELDASSQRSSSARSGTDRAVEPPRPRVPWDPAFAGVPGPLPERKCAA